MSSQQPTRVRDNDGDTWESGPDGLYRIAAWAGHEGAPDALTLTDLTTSFGPLHPGEDSPA